MADFEFGSVTNPVDTVQVVRRGSIRGAELSRIWSCPARIRTWVKGFKVPCATTTPPGNMGYMSLPLAFVLRVRRDRVECDRVELASVFKKPQPH